MKVTVCQLDNRPAQQQEMLAALGTHIEEEKSDFLLIPEMCFHEWLAADREPVATRTSALAPSRVPPNEIL